MPYDLKNGLLPFPLNYLASEGGSDTTPFVDGDKSLITSGENWYVLCLDPDDFNDLLSVIAVGAPIALPDTYGKITQQINQLAQFPNQIPEDSCMDLCQLILDCIGEEAALQQAIATYSLASPIAQNATEIQAHLDAQLVNDPVGCDNDMIFGMTTGFTDLMNDVSEDILEAFVAATSPAGRIGDIIEAIPVIGEAPLDDLFQFVESMMNDINDAYDGAYTVQVRDDIRCDLFCLAKDNDCVLTLEMARDYFFDELAESIDLTTWDGFLDDIIEIIFAGTPAVWGMHLLIVQAMIFGAELVHFDTNRLIRTVQSLYNDPDSDWTTVCDECPTPTNCLNYLDSVENDTVLPTSLCTFQTGGVRMLKGSGGAWRLRMQQNTPVVQAFNQISIEWDASNGVIGSAATLEFVKYTYTDATSDQYTVSFTPPFGDPSGTVVDYAVTAPNPAKTLDQVYISWETVAGGGTSGSCFVEEVCFETV